MVASNLTPQLATSPTVGLQLAQQKPATPEPHPPVLVSTPLTPPPALSPATAAADSPLRGARLLSPNSIILLAPTLALTSTAPTVPVIGLQVVSATSDSVQQYGGFLDKIITPLNPADLSLTALWHGVPYRVAMQPWYGLPALTLDMSGTVPALASAPFSVKDVIATLHLVHDNVISTTLTQGTGTTIAFTEQFANLPVLGTPALTLTLSASGILTHLGYHYMSPASFLGAYQLESEQVAFARLHSGSALYAGPLLLPSALLHVQTVRLGYVGIATTHNNLDLILEPVYQFSGTVLDAANQPAFSAYVPAVRGVPVTTTGSHL